MKKPKWHKDLIRDLQGRFKGNLDEWFREAYFIKGMAVHGHAGMYGVGISETIDFVEKHREEIEKCLK